MVPVTSTSRAAANTLPSTTPRIVTRSASATTSPRTVPLMFVAGFLGAVVGNLLPLEDLKDVAATPAALFGVSLLGVFLPVPIGFDVVVAGTLLNAGLPIGMVMVLLFSLGIFSVYSFIIIGSTITWRTAGMITAAVVIISVIAGLGAEYYQSIQIERTLEYLTN